jgi:hypothetical protein
MAPKTRSTDSAHATLVDSLDPTSQHSSLVHVLDTLALVLEQMSLINARFDAQTANHVLAATFIVADPTVTHRLHDAPREPPRHEQPVELRPPPSPYPPDGYAPPTNGPLFPEAPPHHVPTSRGHPHP